jgi:hypothetical protein
MAQPVPAGGAAPHVFHRMLEAFERPPDNAGVLQGVRPFRTGRPHVRVVLAPSPKNGGHFIACEGRLEAAFAICLEVDPDVLAFRAQPFWIAGPLGRPLVCDFVIKWTNGTYTVVDVKPSGQLTLPKTEVRMTYVRKALSDAQIAYRTITEVELEREPACSIRIQLRKGASAQLPPGGRERVLSHLGRRRLPVHELRLELRELGYPPHGIERLALLGDLSFPLNTRFCETTLIGATHGTDSSAADGWGTVRDVRLPL